MAALVAKQRPVTTVTTAEGEGLKKLQLPGLPSAWLFPTTRYRGSKRKNLAWIWASIKDLQFETALDLFSGTSSVSLLLKRMGKKVSSNDILSFNHQTAIAFIENSCTILSDEDLVTLLSRRNAQSHRGFIASTFKGFYFLDAENKWLDTTVANIVRLREAYSGRTLREKRALAYWALGQACLAKRPFNLFHRRNLYLRTQRVDRTFGNKTTWETPFPVLFSRFARQANKAVFSNGHPNKAFNLDAFAFSEDAYDLVYLDPPYFFEGQRDVDYVQLYHFLEGLMQYERWPSLIDYGTCNLRMQKNGSQWPDTSPSALLSLYRELVSRFSRSIIVISHKSGSRVTIGAWSQILASVGKNVTLRRRRYNYALSKRNGQPRQNIEWLLVAK